MGLPRKVVFFFPYYEVSGVPMLFLRLSSALMDNHGIPTAIIDFPDGYMMRDVRSARIEKISFDYSRPCVIEDSALLVCQSMPPYKFPRNLKPSPETRLVFWTLFPYNFGKRGWPAIDSQALRSPRKYAREFIASLIDFQKRASVHDAVLRMADRGSLWFCDAPNVRATEKLLELKFPDPLILPVPSDDVDENLKLKRAKKIECLNFGWLGRLCDFKIHILNYTINRVSKWARSRRVNVWFYIIGDGEEARLLDAASSRHDFFHVRRVGVLEGASLTDYMLENVDVMGAMGTSSLEAVRLGIPVLRLDICYEPVIDDYRYQWLWEAGEASFGDLITQASFEPGNMTLENRLDRALLEYDALSSKAYDYYVKNHSLGKVSLEFLLKCEQASFRFRDFKARELRKGAIRTIYEYLLY